MPVEFYAALDSDDAWEPWHLATLIEYLDANPEVAGASAMARYIDADSRLGRSAGIGPADVAEVSKGLVVDGMLVHSGLVARMPAVRAVQGYRPKSATVDWDFYQRLAWGGYPLARLGRQTVRYRRHSAHMDGDVAGDDEAPARRECITRAWRRAGLPLDHPDLPYYYRLLGAGEPSVKRWWRGNLRIYALLVRRGYGRYCAPHGVMRLRRKWPRLAWPDRMICALAVALRPCVAGAWAMLGARQLKRRLQNA